MGVRGLTTYVAKNSYLCMEKYELKNCALVIDGNSLASLLYNWHTTCICAFGGDYDSYAYCVHNFFLVLKQCGVSPLVIFDGGYETKKLRTVHKRLRKKIALARHITPTSNNKFFPLLMKEVFKDVLTDLNIPFTQCFFEADDEIAAIARRLTCPVLSYDSDFYVYGVMYIPFSTMRIEVSKRKNESVQKSECYLSCSIFHIDNFLNQFGGLDKSLIPLLATLLGNDYISRNVFKNFFSNYLKLRKKRSVSNTQKYIAALLHWMKSETLESAIEKVLATLKLQYRCHVSRKIRRTIEGYTQCDSEVLPYLDLPLNIVVTPLQVSPKLLCDMGDLEMTDHSNTNDIVNESFNMNLTDESKCKLVDLDSVVDSNCSSSIDEDPEGDDQEDDGQEDDGQEDEEPEDNALNEIDIEFQNLPTQAVTENLPTWFKDSFHRGNFPPSFMDMITRQTYFISPQVEDYNLPLAHEISLPIISVIFGLLTAGNEIEENQLLYYGRNKNHQPEKLYLNRDNALQTDFPQFDTLSELSIEERKAILFHTLNFCDKDEMVIDGLPKDWQIFIMALLYWGRQCHKPMISNCHIHALLLSLVALNVVDKHIGYYRTKPAFLKAFGNKLEIIRESKQKRKSMPFMNEQVKQSRHTDVKNVNYVEKKCVTDLLTVVSLEDCILVAETLLSYHQMNERMKDSRKLYSVTTVHAFAQFQSCLLHIMNLNALLNFPLQQCRTAKFFSGTLIYNAYTVFKKCADADMFIDIILGSGPSVRTVYNLLNLSVQGLLPGIIRKKRKKKRNGRCKDVVVTHCKEKSSCRDTESEHTLGEDDESFQDLNNKFSVLAMNISY